MPHRHASRLALGLFAALALAGCKGKLDHQKLEDFVKSTCEKVGGKVKSVSCPADREEKAGDEFECNGELEDGTKFAAKVKQTDDKGDVDVKVPGRFVNLKTLGDDLEKQAGPGADVKCADKVILMKKGDSFSCDFTADGEKGTIAFTAKDDEGHVDQKIAMAGGAGAAHAAGSASAAPAAE